MVRVKKACVRCNCIVEAPVPSRPIDRGIIGPGLLSNWGDACCRLMAQMDEALYCYVKDIVPASELTAD